MIPAWVIFILSLIVHEFGHVVAFWVMGMSPSIKFRWYIINIGAEYTALLTLKQAIIINSVGILAGLAIVMHLSTEWILTYFLFSSGDLIGIFMFLSEKDKNITIEEFSWKSHMELKKNAKKM